MDSDGGESDLGAAESANEAGTQRAGVIRSEGVPWEVEIDGDDLVVRNIYATCFGGKFDLGDNGQTESGVMNDGFPTADADPMGVALPIRSTEASTRNS